MPTFSNSHAAGDVIRGEKSSFTIREQLPSPGKYAVLYTVTRVGRPDHVYVAKFFRHQVLIHPGPGLGLPEQRAFKRFKKEATFLKLFNHRNIVAYEDQFHDMANDDAGGDECFIVMEHLTGTSLEDSLRQHRHSSAEVITIARGMTAAVVEVHSHNVVHRDIHPGNVFLHHGQPKLIDFGCAIDLAGRITRHHDYQGDYQPLAGRWHRAPEAQDPSSARQESDIFALGMTLLELATHRLIHGAQTDFQGPILWERVDAAIRSLAGEYPPLFPDLLREMLDEHTYNRPTARLVLERLTALESPERHPRQLLARPSPPQRRTSSLPSSVVKDEDEWTTGVKVIGGAIVVGVVAAAAYGLYKLFTAGADQVPTPGRGSSSPAGATIGALAVDLDNTIVHGPGTSGQPGDIDLRRDVVDAGTVELLNQVHERIPVILVTGRRAANYESFRKVVGHSFAIYENGAVIFDPEKGQLEWPGSDKQKLDTLWALERALQAQGFITTKEGRLASFRIEKADSGRGEEDLRCLLSPGTKLISNGPHWDFVLSEAGKGKSLQFVLGKLQVECAKCAAIGDDLNDLDMLECVGFPMTFETAHARVVASVRKRGGYIAKEQSGQSIAEVLRHVIGLIPEGRKRPS